MSFEPYVDGGHLILSPSGHYIPADTLQREYHVEVFRYALIAIYAMYLWEWIVTLHEEVARWKELLKGQFLPVNICLLVSRYSTIAALVASAVVFFGDSVPNCQAGLNLVYVFFQPGQICHVIISVLRVHALSNGSNQIWRPLSVLGFVTCVIWIAAIPFFKAGPVEPAMAVHYQPVCQPLPSPAFRVMGWGAAAGFDMIMYVVSTMLISSRLLSAFSPKAKRFMHDTTTFLFLVSITANLSCFFTILFYKNLILANVPIPIQFVLNSVVATRIVLHTDVWMDRGKTGLLVLPRSTDINHRGLGPAGKPYSENDIAIALGGARAAPRASQGSAGYVEGGGFEAPFIDRPYDGHRRGSNSKVEGALRFFNRRDASHTTFHHGHPLTPRTDRSAEDASVEVMKTDEAGAPSFIMETTPTFVPADSPPTRHIRPSTATSSIRNFGGDERERQTSGHSSQPSRSGAQSVPARDNDGRLRITTEILTTRE
ncbi:hypothetical protein CBOM_05356 [Ceraceosorus bombacis]|uniref:Uncharacterized protein n=1 Tax=Ceraceosorus bombacis TaxID=401625 RepID=A0A0P1BQ42_9BASI|nr:hypothetical protein CBOM_05356 [Ceraceosorus bombacis]